MVHCELFHDRLHRLWHFCIKLCQCPCRVGELLRREERLLPLDSKGDAGEQASVVLLKHGTGVGSVADALHVHARELT
jgi:hypothetical protein